MKQSSRLQGIMSTKDTVITLRQADPTIPNCRLAQITGVSKARIRSILIETGLRTKVYKKYCIVCSKPNTTNGKTCSRECRHHLFSVICQCEWCNKDLDKNKKQFERDMQKNKHVFCSHSCRHKWYWKNNPELLLGKRIATQSN